jgi:hypothetical protein
MYFIAMSLRMVCVGSLFWVRGWWVLLAAAGAILLPWFAVMVGNAVAFSGDQELDAIEPLELESGAYEAPVDSVADTLLVVDVDPERRSSRSTASPPLPQPGGDVQPETGHAQ